MSIFILCLIAASVLFVALFVYLIYDTAQKRKKAKQETQEYYVATTDADDED